MGAPKQKWTEEEEVALRKGVERYGPGKWRAIQKDPKYGPFLTQRSNVDLKDKWRIMSRAEGEPPRSRKMNQGTSSRPAKRAASTGSEDDEEAARKKKRRDIFLKYGEMITEAVAALKEKSGSSLTSIAKYIEDNHAVPFNFRRLIGGRLKTMVEEGMLIKGRGQAYRLNDGTATESFEKPVKAKTPRTKTDSERSRSKLELGPDGNRRQKTAEEAAKAAALAIAEAEAAAEAAEQAMREAELAEQEAAEAEAAAEAAAAAVRPPKKRSQKGVAALQEAAEAEGEHGGIPEGLTAQLLGVDAGPPGDLRPTEQPAVHSGGFDVGWGAAFLAGDPERAAQHGEGESRPEGLVRQEGLVGPEGLARPEGSVRPEGLMRPEGLSRPEGLVRPEGFVRTEGLVAQGDSFGALMGLSPAQGLEVPTGLREPDGAGSVPLPRAGHPEGLTNQRTDAVGQQTMLPPPDSGAPELGRNLAEFGRPNGAGQSQGLMGLLQDPSPSRDPGVSQGFATPQGLQPPQGLMLSQVSEPPPPQGLQNPQGLNVPQGLQRPEGVARPEPLPTVDRPQGVHASQAGESQQGSAPLTGPYLAADAPRAEDLAAPLATGTQNPEGLPEPNMRVQMGGLPNEFPQASKGPSDVLRKGLGPAVDGAPVPTDAIDPVVPMEVDIPANAQEVDGETGHAKS